MGELNLALKTYPRILISRPNGTWMDVTRWARTASIDLGDVSGVGTGKTGADGICRMLELSLGNERSGLDGISFSFKDLTSPINQIDGQFAPLLQDGREIILQTAQLPFGIEAMEQDFKTIFHGVLGDDFKATRNGAEIMCRDLSYKASGPHAFMYDVVTYGSEEGILAETVIQQMFDDVLGTGILSLYCPETTGWMVKEFTPRYQTPWNVANDIVNQFGWYFGFMTAPDGLYRPHLIEPPRYADVETADFYIDWNGDIKTQSIQTSGLGIRNWIIVRFTDESGERIELNPNDYPELKDQNSIDEYDKRPMLIELDDNSQIKTVEEGLTLGGYALFDLSSKVGTTRVDMPYFQKMDVFKSMVIRNRAISSTDDFYGCLSVRHEFDFSQIPATGTTTFLANGKVVGGHRRWLDRETRVGAPGQPINSGRLDPARPPAPLGLQIAKNVRVARTGQVVLENMLTWNQVSDLGIEYLVERSINSTDWYQVGITQRGSERYTDSNLEEDTTYYYRIKSRYTATGKTSWSGGMQSVTVDQIPEAPGGTITLTAEAEINAIRVTINHENAPADIATYKVYAETTSSIDPNTNQIRDGLLPKSNYLGMFHTVPATPGESYYIAVVAVNSSGLAGLPVEIQGGQSKLTSRRDMDASMWQVNVTVSHSDAITYHDVYDILRYPENLVYAWVIDYDFFWIQFEYPVAHIMDALEYKVYADDLDLDLYYFAPASIQYYDDTIQDWRDISYTVQTISGDLKRFNFDEMRKIYKFRLNFSGFRDMIEPGVNRATRGLELYCIKPRIRGFFDLIDAEQVNANQVNVITGNPDDNHQIITTDGIEGYVKGEDGILRLASIRKNTGEEIMYNPNFDSGTTYKGIPVGKLTWLKGSDGTLRDSRNYPVIDINGDTAERVVAQGTILEPDDIISWVLIGQTITISENKILFVVIEPFEYGYLIDTNINIDYIVEQNGAFIVDGVMHYYLEGPAVFEDVDIRILFSVTEWAGSGIADQIYFPFRWKIVEVNKNTTVYDPIQGIPIIQD